MKTVIALALILVSTSSFAYTVVDSMYENTESALSERVPASNGSKFCLVDDAGRTFGKSCYSSAELCEKRLSFWNDLPEAKPTKCSKI